MKTKKSSEKNLEKRKFQFFQIGLCFALAITLVAFEWRSLVSTSSLPDSDPFEDFTYVEDIIRTERKEKPDPKTEESSSQKKEGSELNLVDDLDDKKEDDLEKIIAVNTANIDDLFEEEKTTDSSGFNSGPEFFVVVEDMPCFFGCETELTNDERKECTDKKIMLFFRQHQNYPAMAKELGETGTVYIQFIINRKGKVDGVKVVKDPKHPVHRSLENEAVRLVKKLPDFIPGRQRSVPVSVQHTARIRFSLH